MSTKMSDFDEKKKILLDTRDIELINSIQSKVSLLVNLIDKNISKPKSDIFFFADIIVIIRELQIIGLELNNIGIQKESSFKSLYGLLISYFDRGVILRDKLKVVPSIYEIFTKMGVADIDRRLEMSDELKAVDASIHKIKACFCTYIASYPPELVSETDRLLFELQRLSGLCSKSSVLLGNIESLVFVLEQVKAYIPVGGLSPPPDNGV